MQLSTFRFFLLFLFLFLFLLMLLFGETEPPSPTFAYVMQGMIGRLVPSRLAQPSISCSEMSDEAAISTAGASTSIPSGAETTIFSLREGEAFKKASRRESTWQTQKTAFEPHRYTHLSLLRMHGNLPSRSSASPNNNTPQRFRFFVSSQIHSRGFLERR